MVASGPTLTYNEVPRLNELKISGRNPNSKGIFHVKIYELLLPVKLLVLYSPNEQKLNTLHG